MSGAGSRGARNEAFDRLRGIGAVMVVLIHAPPFLHSSVPSLRSMGWLLRESCQLAVPFFLLLSGYLLGRKWRSARTSWRDLGGVLGRLGTLYLPWFALFLSLDVARDLPHDPVTVLRRLTGFSLAGPDTTGYHLWFLPSLALAQCAAWASLKWTKSVIPSLVAGGLLFAWMYAREVLLLSPPLGMVATEGLNLSLLAVSLGVFVGARDPKWTPPAGLVVVAVLSMFAEGAILSATSPGKEPVHTFQVFRVLAAAAILLWAIPRPQAWSFPRLPLLDLLGRHATAIYTSHLGFLLIVPFDRLVPNGFVRDNLVRWPVAICGAVALSLLLRRLGGGVLRKLVD